MIYVLGDYTVHGTLYSSRKSKLYFAVNNTSGDKVVIKRVSIGRYYPYIKNEISYANKFKKHPFIITMSEHFRIKDTYYLVYPRGITDLFEAMRDNRLKRGQYGGLDLDVIKFILANIVEVLDHMHSRHYVHRDIKCENVIMDKDGYFKLIDFEFCKRIKTPTMEPENGLYGTLLSLAPEVFACQEYSKAVDVFALGCLLHEMTFNFSPFDEKDKLRTQSRMKRPLPDHMDIYLKNLIIQCLDPHPRQRITIQAMKQHPFLRGISFPQLRNKEIVSPVLSTLTK